MWVHPATERIKPAVLADLAAAGVVVTVTELPAAARTAATAAAQLGVEVGAIANSLVFEADGAPLLVMTSGAHRVDTDALADAIGVGRIRRADPEFVRRHTGQPIGGVAPVGHPGRLRTIVDRDLADHPQLWVAAGHPHTVFPLDYQTLLAITAGTAMTVTTR